MHLYKKTLRYSESFPHSMGYDTCAFRSLSVVDAAVIIMSMACICAFNINFSLPLSEIVEPLEERFGVLRPPPPKGNWTADKFIAITPPPYPKSNTFRTNDIVSNETWSILETREVNEYTTEVTVQLPSFYWETPRGLTKDTAEVFWKQPENHRHFDGRMHPTTGIVEIYTDCQLTGYFSSKVEDSKYVNYNRLFGTPVSEPVYDAVMYMTRHEVQYFQHFLDNGIPHISLMQFASGIDPSEVTFVMDSWNTPMIPYLLKRYGFKDVIRRSGAISAKKLIIPKVVPVLSPLYTQYFLNRLNLTEGKNDKVILISRTHGDGTKPMRLITNQESLENALRKKFGSNFVVFKAKGAKIENTMSLFSEAKYIIGSHGGAMYNALWAPLSAKVVEIMPIRLADGVYPMQGHTERMPPFAHLAIYTNSNMKGQAFYRFYADTDHRNYEVNVDEFMKWFEEYVM